MYGYEGEDNNKHGERTEAKGKGEGNSIQKRKVRTYLVGTVNVGCKKEALSVSHRTICFFFTCSERRQEKRKRKKKRRKRKARKK